MAEDDPTKRGPADRSRVNVHEDYELRYWTGHFGCTADELREAVREVGVMRDEVEEYLREQGYID